jgi:integrase
MRAVNKLTATKILAPLGRGLYGDGNGLYLQVSTFGTKAWVYRYQRNGTARMMGLGPVNTSSVAAARKSLSGARERAQDAHELLLRETDPIEARRDQRQQVKAATARRLTFKECAERYIKAHRSSWKNQKHAAQWPATLSQYVYPTIGALSVSDIDTGLVMKCLEPMWRDTPETAKRVRGRIEAVLDWAKAHDHRSGENPARWRGHLKNLLPSRNKLERKPKHLPALPYAEVAEFLAELRAAHDGISSLALEFAILTAARSGEVLGARWDELDLDGRVWTVAAERMKGGREHFIPLSDRAVEVLEALPRLKGTDFVFPGTRAGKPLSENSMLDKLRGFRPELTVHGFRSTFRDWAGDCTNHPREVVEAALAHVIGDKAEAAYRRSTAVEKRRHLMADWARYCSQKPGTAKETVVSIAKAGAPR